MAEENEPMILIVDRRLSTLTPLAALLSRGGYGLTTCSSAAEALNSVIGQKVDLVIVGKGGPKQKGEDLVSRIKHLSPETRILLLIDSNDDTKVTDVIAAGADGLLRRSYSEIQVLQRVERLLHTVRTW